MNEFQLVSIGGSSMKISIDHMRDEYKIIVSQNGKTPSEFEVSHDEMLDLYRWLKDQKINVI